MTPEELQEYLKFKKKGGQIQNRKGKGSYTRKEKYKFLKSSWQASESMLK